MVALDFTNSSVANLGNTNFLMAGAAVAPDSLTQKKCRDSSTTAGWMACGPLNSSKVTS